MNLKRGQTTSKKPPSFICSDCDVRFPMEQRVIVQENPTGAQIDTVQYCGSCADAQEDGARTHRFYFERLEGQARA